MKAYLFIMEKIGEDHGGRAVTRVRVVKRALENGVTFIKGWFTDLPGFAKSLAVTVDELEKTLGEKAGMNVDYGHHEAVRPRRGGIGTHLRAL